MLVLNIPFQPASEEVYNSKYNLKNKRGKSIDGNLYGTFGRVAEALAKYEEDHDYWSGEFMWALLNGAIPAGRILSNAGAEKYKPSTSLINCLAGETPVLTRQGLVPIKELADCKVEVLNGKGQWTEVEFRSFGVQPVYSLYFAYADNKKQVKVRATADHRWFMMDGQVITTEFWLTGGHPKYVKVPHLRAPEVKLNAEDYELGVLHGAVYGDGTRISGDKYGLPLIGNKMEVAPVIAAVTGCEPQPRNYGDNEALWFGDIRSLIELKSLPLDPSPSYLRGFFAGLLATDGGVYGSDGRSVSVALYGSKEVIEFMENRLPVIGITPTSKKMDFAKGEVTNLCTRKSDVWKLTVHPATINEDDILRSFHRDAYRRTVNGDYRSTLWTFKGIDKSPEMEEVFCCHEPETTAFCIFSGMKTGQCVVASDIEDSIGGIGKGVYEAGISLSAGCGIGYCFSTLRPKGAHVNGVGAKTSGPLPFMDVYDKMCFTVASAGGRRGAQMATFDVRHPDIIDFVKAKREDGRFRQFNVSVLVTKKFLNAVEKDSYWNLVFPVRDTELELVDEGNLVWEPWHIRDHSYTVNEQGLVLCKIYGTVRARELWDLIASSAYDYAEPGVIFIDAINEYNNLWFEEYITSTNPCGEEPLPPYGACLLGSVNLTHFVKEPFKDSANFDMENYIKVVRIFTRMLDNVVEMNGLPLEQQRKEIFRKRRHGMGITGLGSAMAMLGIKYGSPTAVAMTEELTRVMAIEGWKVGVELAKEKGPAPIMDEPFTVTSEMLALRPEMVEDGWEVGMPVTGKILMVNYSRYLRNLRTEDMGDGFWEDFEQYGSRFTHHTSIAPTGTISLSVGNNVSNGIEPSFAHHYQRNLTVEGKKTRQQTDVYSFELLAYRHLVDPNAMPGVGNGSGLPDYFVTADDVHWKEHLDIQCAAQKWIDSSISKTINVPTKIGLDDFKDVYTYAAARGAKGTAVFRYNPETLQGVLVRNEDLRSTKYRFVMEDGSELELFGNDKVEYDGEVHVAANLYDAMKERVYGRF